jgi:Tfp pilus assembly protein PilF
MDPGDKTETYADTRAFGLVESCVVPYLHERYGDEYAAFRRWEMQHAGCSLPLEILVDERPQREWLGNAFIELVFALAAGEDPLDARAGYAESLALNRRHEDAQQVVDGVLGERPEHAGALLTRAVVAFRRGDNDVAERSCRSALASSPDAELLLGRLLCSQGRWQELAEVTTHALTKRERDHRLRVLRARARVELLELDAAAEDVAVLQRSPDHYMQREAAVIDALRLCRGGRWDEALAAGERLLDAKRLAPVRRAEMRALVLECALRLGRDDRLVPLEAAEVAELRGRGHDAWMNRLMAELRAWSARAGEGPTEQDAAS